MLLALVDRMQSATQTDHPEKLATRTRRFAVSIVRFYIALPKSGEHFVLGRQLLRSGTSVGAHYREARRAKSNADFVSKMEGALQELDETAYWLEVLEEAGLTHSAEAGLLTAETNELISIFVKVVKKVKAGRLQPA
jgi:four helix bundle protein